MNFETIWKRTLDRYKDSKPAGDTTKYRRTTFEPKTKHKKYQTVVTVKNIDTVEEAIFRPNSLMLNMASARNPGGPNKCITGAQEEDISRRSNLHLYLDRKFYPIDGCEVLISKNVEIYSKGLRGRYEEYPEAKHIDIVSCAGVRNHLPGIRLEPSSEYLLRGKLETLFQAALSAGYKDLVLSAIGCGAFRCPPEHVSLIFKDLIKKYDGCFENIIFAIYDDNFPKSNYAIFKDCF